jgi:integrase/recombinase XerC
MTQLRSFIKQYQNHLSQDGKSPHTIRGYGQDVTSFGKWWEQSSGEAFQPQAVVFADILEYRGFLLRQAAPATVNRRLNALKGFFAWAKDKGLATDSPFETLKTVYVKQQRAMAPRWLDHKEQLALLRAVKKAKHERDLAIIQTFLGTGLRISELAALRVVDLKISERKGSLQVKAGKGMKARQIPLNNQTRQALEAYLEVRKEHSSGRLWLGQRGPLGVRAIEKVVAKYVYQARLEKCTAHTLRHSFAKNLIDTGTSLEVVASLLGHENLNTTRIYTQPSEQDLERAVRRAAGEV